MPTVEAPASVSSYLDGWKTFSGLSIVVIPVLAGFFGYDVRDAFPVEIARFGEEGIILVGAAIAFYGRLKAKGPMWFAKVKKI